MGYVIVFYHGKKEEKEGKEKTKRKFVRESIGTLLSLAVVVVLFHSLANELARNQARVIVAYKVGLASSF